MSHNILAPSAGHRWLHCTQSIPETLGAIDESSEYADEGTAAHTMASWCLSNSRDAKDYPAATIDVLDDDGKVRRTFKADDEMKSFVQVYLDAIRDRVHEGALLLVEQRVYSGLESMLYGPSDGTCDAGLIAPQFKLIESHDLKFGRGVHVDALTLCTDEAQAVGPVVTINKLKYELNVQLCIYALGLIRLAKMLGYEVDDWQVRIVIHQPRLDGMSDADISVRDLLAWAEWAQGRLSAIDSGEALHYAPGEKTCRWCPKKATCVALAQHVANTISSEFSAVPDLTDWGIGKALERTALAEQWIKAVRAAAWAALNAGQKIPGWKLAQGRDGNSKWADPDAVEDIMKNRYRFTYEEMYEKKLQTPTKAWQKKFAATHPLRWEDIRQHIKRDPGKLTLVREGDAAPAYDLTDEMASV